MLELLSHVNERLKRSITMPHFLCRGNNCEISHSNRFLNFSTIHCFGFPQRYRVFRICHSITLETLHPYNSSDTMWAPSAKFSSCSCKHQLVGFNFGINQTAPLSIQWFKNLFFPASVESS